jgi:tetratricopeptide (TPR) repeat protein
MGSKQYQDAAKQLDAALAANPENFAIGFVMARALTPGRNDGPAHPSSADYRTRIFPQTHTKLSYILYRLGDLEHADAEAKLGEAADPQNAGARKNMGLALEAEQKFDAAIAEYQEAPDCASPRAWKGWARLMQRRAHSKKPSSVSNAQSQSAKSRTERRF